MAKPNKNKVPLLAAQPQPFNNPFTKVEAVSVSVAVSSPAPSVPASAPLSLAHCGKIVIRRERKGRGGKTVTTITGLRLPQVNGITMLMEHMRKSLGCGAHLEDDAIIVLQGPLEQRAAQYLRRLGAQHLVVS